MFVESLLVLEPTVNKSQFHSLLSQVDPLDVFNFHGKRKIAKGIVSKNVLFCQMLMDVIFRVP